MNGDDERDKSGDDDFQKASRINFRDYPSTALVVLGALGSGLAWVLYKWLDKKSTAKDTVQDQAEEARDSSLRPKPPERGT